MDDNVKIKFYWDSLDYCLWIELARKDYHGQTDCPVFTYNKQEITDKTPCKYRIWPQQLPISQTKFSLN